MKRLGLLVLALAACNGGDKDVPPCELISSDVRVDAAGDGDAIESGNGIMCVNSKSEVSIVWIDDRDGTPQVWFNASRDGGVTWKPTAIRVDHGEGSNVSYPAIGCSESAVYVAWEDDRDGDLQNHNIYANRSLDLGDTWLDDDINIDVDPEGRTFSQGPFIAVAGTAAYIAWFDNVFGAYDIYIAGSADEGLTWGSPVRVDSDGPGDAYSAYPQVVANTNGTVMVAWEDARSGKNDIYLARSDNGGGNFDTDTRIDGGDDPGAANSFSPRLAADGDNVYVAWHDKRNTSSDDGPSDIYTNFSADGGRNWSSVAAIVESPEGNSPGFFNSRFPVLAVKAGKAVVAWEDNRFANYDIFSRVLENGLPVGPETRLDLGNEELPSAEGVHTSLDTRLAASGSNVVVMWADSRAVVNPDDGFSDLYYNFSSDFGATWSPADLRMDNVEAGAAFKQDINLALVGDTMFASWTDGRTGSADIYTHTMKIGEEAAYVIVGEQECFQEDVAPE